MFKQDIHFSKVVLFMINNYDNEIERLINHGKIREPFREGICTLWYFLKREYPENTIFFDINKFVKKYKSLNSGSYWYPLYFKDGINALLNRRDRLVLIYTKLTARNFISKIYYTLKLKVIIK